MDEMSLNIPLRVKNDVSKEENMNMEMSNFSTSFDSQNFSLFFTNTDGVFNISPITSKIIFLVNPISGSKHGQRILDYGKELFQSNSSISFFDITDSLNFTKGLDLLKEMQVI